MKKLIFGLIFGLIFISCKEKETKPEFIDNIPFEESTYEKVYNDSDIKILKVIQFTKERIVKISYRHVDYKLYTNVGEFNYYYDHPLFVVINPDGTTSKGQIVDNYILFGGEKLIKKKS